ncbi:MAG: hypothetical protein JNJ54_01705 [Myxococcaceae bacterium]|nr:hypothetical protein [Myxococcaceae bacterium]
MKLLAVVRHPDSVQRWCLALALVNALPGCFEPPCEAASEPGGPFVPCAAPGDAGRSDAGATDAGRADAGAGDAGRADAGRADAGLDAGRADAGRDGGLLPTSDAGVRVIDFGTLVLGDAGLSRELSFLVEPADEGFQVQVVGLGPSLDTYQVNRIFSPSGTVVAMGPDYRRHLSWSRPDVNVANAVVLESDDARREWVPGLWRFSVESRRPVATTAVAVKVFVKPRPPPGPQRLAINLLFTGSAGLTAATAPAQPRLTTAMNVFRDIFADAGITLDAPRYFDLPPGFSAITSTWEDAGSPPMGRSLEALLRQSSLAPAGMNLFFVETLILDPQLPPGFILGVAGGVPGATMTNGTGASGVAILFDSPRYVPAMGEDDPLGLVLAHEVAHQLGLSHVFELTGLVDNLRDTPTSGVDAEKNLMAPTATGNGSLSPSQGVTLRRNPVVRP